MDLIIQVSIKDDDTLPSLLCDGTGLWSGVAEHLGVVGHWPVDLDEVLEGSGVAATDDAGWDVVTSEADAVAKAQRRGKALLLQLSLQG